jgi:hypothetical protein
MSRRERIAKELLVEPGTDADLAGRDPAWPRRQSSSSCPQSSWAAPPRRCWSVA